MLRFSKVRRVNSPKYSSDGAAGIDFFHPSDWSTVLSPNQETLIPSGIKVNIPENYSLIAYNKSGVAVKKGLAVKACVIDSDYQGEVLVHLRNESTEIQIIDSDSKMIQFIYTYTPQVVIEECSIEDLYISETDRGSGGFGSTDNK